MAARSGGLGQAMRDIGRAIGSALGIGGGGTASGRGGTVSSIGRDIAAARSPALSRADRDGPDRSERQVAQPAPAPVPAPVPVVEPVVTPAPPPPPAPVDLAAPTTSETEAAAVESTKRGRAATILTGMQGLLAEQEATGQLRRRRSLMGGGLIQ